MATVIRLQRGGRKKRPFYSVVVMDSRNRRDGAFIEKLGYFDPCKHPEVIEIDQERAKHWIGLGAAASGRVKSLMKAAAEGPARIERLEKEAATKKAAEDAKKNAEAKAAEDAKKAEEAAAKKAEKVAAAEAAAEAPAEEAAAETAPEEAEAPVEEVAVEASAEKVVVAEEAKAPAEDAEGKKAQEKNDA